MEAAGIVVDIPKNLDVQQQHQPSSKSVKRVLARKLVADLSDPTKLEELKTRYSNVRLSWFDKARLEQLREKTGHQTHTETIRVLLQSYESRSENLIPEATLELIFGDDQPVCLSGKPGTGKSTYIKNIIPRIPHPVLLFDIAAEYSTLKRLADPESVLSVKWQKAKQNTRLRFIPASDADFSKSQLRHIFSGLNTAKLKNYNPRKTPSGNMSDWVVVVEESHRLARETSFLSFLTESRKYLAKILLVCSDPSIYQNLCRLVKPPPLNHGNQS